MAIALEFIDFVVPIATIKEKYPGGWRQCLIDHEGLIGGRVWYDEHLFRDGAMNPADIESLIEEWQARGFQATEVRDGKQVWKDVCVVEVLFGGPTASCDWITVDRVKRTAHLTGSTPSAVASRGTLGHRGEGD